VLDADVDALLDVAVADLAVEDDTDGGLGHVVDDTGLSVVDLVWLCRVLVAMSRGSASPWLEVCASIQDSTYHALLDGTIGDDINDIADLVLSEVGRQSDHTLLLEVAREGCQTALVIVPSIPQSFPVFHIFLPSPISQRLSFGDD
jgi:hypothetical protein